MAEQIIVVNETAESDNQDPYPVQVRKNGVKRNLSTRLGPWRGSRRLVRKSGAPEVRPSTSLRSLLAPIYLQDLANTLIHCDWKWTLVVVYIVFMSTWFVFACVWMVISLNNGDLDAKDGPSEPCLSGIQGFAGYMMFSVETQASIGYGNRYINHYCPEAVVVLCLQIISGVCICGILVSIVYGKISGPGKINSMNSFTKHAVICQRDGELCLIFRARDCDGRYQCHNEIKAYLVQKRGEELLLKSIKLESTGILIWPIEVVHRITETSPFWDLSARDLIMKRFEIIVAMEGTSLSTSNTSSTTTSYLSKEIRWGHIFAPCVKYDREEGRYFVDHKLFNKTKETATPLCSARRLQEVFRDMSGFDCCDFSLTNSPSLSDDVRRDKGNGSSDVTSVTVHASNSEESKNFGDDSEGSANGDSGFGENWPETRDPLLATLEKFVEEDGKVAKRYEETSF